MSVSSPPGRQGSLTYEGVGDVGPVNAALQFELVVGLDIEKEMLVEANTSHQVGPVGTFQCAPAVDVLEVGRAKGLAKQEVHSTRPLCQPGHHTEKVHLPYGLWDAFSISPYLYSNLWSPKLGPGLLLQSESCPIPFLLAVAIHHILCLQPHPAPSPLALFSFGERGLKNLLPKF